MPGIFGLENSKHLFVQMDLERDQKELRRKNIQFLRSITEKFYEGAFSNFAKEYDKRIQQNVMDPGNKIQLQDFLETEFQKTREEDYFHFEGVKIENNKFVCSFEPILQYAINNQLINRIYPTLESHIGNGFFPREYIFLQRSIKNTARLLYLKHLSSHFVKEIKMMPPKKNLNLSKAYSHSLFKFQETEDFFDFLFNNWIKEIDIPFIQLSYIFRSF